MVAHMQSSFNEPRKRRILFIITQSELGGAQQFLVQLLSHLDKNIYECIAVTGSDGGAELQAVLPPEVPAYTATNLKRQPGLISDLKAVGELKSIIIKEKPDIVFLMSSKAGFVGSIAARLAKSSLPSLHIAYRIGGWTFNDPWPTWKKWLYRFLERASASWKDIIVVNSAKDLEDAKKYKIRSRRKPVLIHNGIDPYRELFSQEEARIRLFDAAVKSRLARESGVGPSLFHAKAIVGTVANFYPAKDLLTFINAVDALPEGVVGIIIGDGPLAEKLENHIREHGLSRKVFLAGRLVDAYKYLPAFDVFALSSNKEGFPWAIIEAMSAKIPVISTPVGAIPEIIKDGQNGIIVPVGIPAAMSSAIRNLLKDDRLRQELVIQAHQTIIAQFSIHAMVERFENLFKSLLDTKAD